MMDIGFCDVVFLFWSPRRFVKKFVRSIVILHDTANGQKGSKYSVLV